MRCIHAAAACPFCRPAGQISAAHRHHRPRPRCVACGRFRAARSPEHCPACTARGFTALRLFDVDAMAVAA